MSRSSSSDIYEPIDFRAGEKEPVERATQPPQCMLDLPKADLQRRELTSQEAEVAISDVCHKDFIKLAYPKTVRMHKDPPIPSQVLGLYSFIPSKGATPDSDGAFGVLKIRGCFPNELLADAYASELIRKHDSHAIIDYCNVGLPVPLLVDNEMYRKSTKEVDIRKKVDETMHTEIKKRREQERRDMDEVQHRQEQLLKDVKQEKDENVVTDDLDFYVQVRVKQAHLRYTRDNLDKKEKEIGNLLKQVGAELTELEEHHPEYKNQYMDRYRQALASSGVDESKNPIMPYFTK